MGKHAKKDKWELYMAKFVRRFSHKDAQLIENNEYLSCDMSAKVKRKQQTINKICHLICLSDSNCMQMFRSRVLYTL